MKFYCRVEATCLHAGGRSSVSPALQKLCLQEQRSELKGEREVRKVNAVIKVRRLIKEREDEVGIHANIY